MKHKSTATIFLLIIIIAIILFSFSSVFLGPINVEPLECSEPNPTSQTMCESENACKCGSSYEDKNQQQCEDSGCDWGPIPNIVAACGAAFDLAPNPAGCPAGCQDDGIYLKNEIRNDDTGCCTIVKGRRCSSSSSPGTTSDSVPWKSIE